tara:strand:- start:9175 stop:9468 length:294 start_codon:yes stop_codon:yes gene_type:complete
MDRFLTYNDRSIIAVIARTYFCMTQTARSFAFAHVKNRDNENYNPFHFEHGIQELNNAISELIKLMPENDNRSDDYPLLTEEKLIEAAEHFFSIDIY